MHSIDATVSGWGRPQRPLVVQCKVLHPPASRVAQAILAALILIGAAVPSSAATIWTGALNTALNNSANWDNGLPDSVGNPGTIPAAAGSLVASFNYNDYFVTQDGGVLTSGNVWTLSSGTWTLNSGGSISGNTHGVALQGADNGHQGFLMTGGTLDRVSSSGTNRSASFTMSGGDFDLTGQLTVNAGGTVNISGGSVDIGTNLRINDVAAFVNISGGTVTIASMLGRGGTTTFTGGTTTSSIFEFPSSTFLVFDAGSPGSYTTGSFAGSASNRNTNWLSGTLMSMTLTGDANWAETEWSNNRMFFDGDSSFDLGLTWADVINPSVGFNAGGGTYFDWDGGTNTLQLVTVPEPSSLVLVGLAGAGFVVASRMRKRGRTR